MSLKLTIGSTSTPTTKIYCNEDKYLTSKIMTYITAVSFVNAQS